MPLPCPNHRLATLALALALTRSAGTDPRVWWFGDHRRRLRHPPSAMPLSDIQRPAEIMTVLQKHCEACRDTCKDPEKPERPYRENPESPWVTFSTCKDPAETLTDLQRLWKSTLRDLQNPLEICKDPKGPGKTRIDPERTAETITVLQRHCKTCETCTD